MAETLTESKYVTRKEMIKELGISIFNRGVETKQVILIKNGDRQNCKQWAERTEWEAFKRTLRKV